MVLSRLLYMINHRAYLIVQGRVICSRIGEIMFPSRLLYMTCHLAFLMAVVRLISIC